MFKLFSKFALLFLVAFPVVLLSGVAHAQEDPVEDEVNTEEDVAQDDESDSKVETEEEATTGDSDAAATDKDATEEEEEKPSGIGPSADAETTVLFPQYPDKQLPAGKPIHVLVGFNNKGEKDFIIETVDASFRYPQDYSYHIQNFTATMYNRVVQPGQEATFQYAFHPHESYGGRPFGLTVLMMYKDAEGNQFGAGVFNETVTFTEVDDSFDGETFFLYVLLAAVGLLIVFGLNYAFSSSKGGKRSAPKPDSFEQGTQNGDVDYDWLPKETTTDFNKASPRQSPRQRRSKRAGASSGESAGEE